MSADNMQGPFTIELRESDRVRPYQILNVDKDEVARCIDEYDAAFIVNACDCHYDLLAALQSAVDLMVQEDFATLSLVPHLRAAIAKATGGST